MFSSKGARDINRLSRKIKIYMEDVQYTKYGNHTKIIICDKLDLKTISKKF